VAEDLCDHCAKFVMHVLLWMSKAHTPAPGHDIVDALMREVVTAAGMMLAPGTVLRCIHCGAAVKPEDAAGHICLDAGSEVRP